MSDLVCPGGYASDTPTCPKHQVPLIHTITDQTLCAVCESARANAAEKRVKELERQITPPSAEAFHPGEYLRDGLTACGWSVETFCERSGLRRDCVEELLAEKRQVTMVIAKCISNAFGQSEEMWLRLQAAFDAHRKAAQAAGGENHA